MLSIQPFLQKPRASHRRVELIPIKATRRIELDSMLIAFQHFECEFACAAGARNLFDVGEHLGRDAQAAIRGDNGYVVYVDQRATCKGGKAFDAVNQTYRPRFHRTPAR